MEVAGYVGARTKCVVVFQAIINCNLIVVSDDLLADSTQRDARALGRMSELVKHSRSQASAPATR